MTVKPRIIAMVPVRYGSTRVKKKNLRLIDGKPLVSYVLDTLLETNVFDEIYLNSEHEIFEKIALEKGINFYKRDPFFATNVSTNDEFAFDFMKNTRGDILIQILATSPLVTAKEITTFVNHMLEEKLETLVSVERNQISNIYKKAPINFDKLRPNPLSQNMEPVYSYASVLMGWTYESFKSNMERFNCAYHGGDSKTDYFEVSGLSTIDIDREEDFLLAESIIISKKYTREHKIEYYGENL